MGVYSLCHTNITLLLLVLELEYAELVRSFYMLLALRCIDMPKPEGLVWVEKSPESILRAIEGTHMYLASTCGPMAVSEHSLCRVPVHGLHVYSV